MRHINFSSGAQNGVLWVGAKKLMLKKLMSCFFDPFLGAILQRNDLDSSPKVRVTGQKSELWTKKSELQPGRPPESEPNRPEKGANGVQVLLQKTPP